MAELCRITKLHDKLQNQTFTFILPPATAADTPPEISSRDFSYAGHRWRLSLLKKDKHLSPYLICTNLSPGLRCTVDFSITLINRESFTQNESFLDKEKTFECKILYENKNGQMPVSTNGISSSTFKNSICSMNSIDDTSLKLEQQAHQNQSRQVKLIDQNSHYMHGRRTFITLTDLIKRKFADSRGEYIMEVNMKNPRTTFTCWFDVVKPKLDMKTNQIVLDYQRYDSPIFVYGDMEWQCIFCPNMITSDANNGKLNHMLQIVRKNKTEILCKLASKIIIGNQKLDLLNQNNYRPPATIRSEIFDFNGNGQIIPFYFDQDYCRLLDENSRLELNLELYSMTLVNQVKLNLAADLVQSTTNDSSAASTVTKNNSIFSQQLIDKDKQTWQLSVVNPKIFTTDNLVLCLQYIDFQNIPKNYARHVTWDMKILPVDKFKSAICSLNVASSQKTCPMEGFYCQFYPDKGLNLKMDTKIQELRENSKDWLDEHDNRVTVEIEWFNSYLLYNPAYNSHDDIYRKHIAQMRREITSLQLENNDLEKELHKYHVSIGRKVGLTNSSNNSDNDSPSHKNSMERVRTKTIAGPIPPPIAGANSNNSANNSRSRSVGHQQHAMGKMVASPVGQGASTKNFSIDRNNCKN